MTTTIQTAPMANTARLARYRQAEQDLWHAYGLEPIERFVEVSLPRAVVRLRVLEIGAGEPAVFIPGTGGTGPYWAPLIRELPGIRCVMIDRPGWGLSSPLDYRDLRLRGGRGGDPRRRARRPGPGSSRRRRRIDRASVGAAPGPTRTGASPADRGPRRWAERGPARTALHPASRVTTRCRDRPDPIVRADAPRPAGGDWPWR